MDPTPNISPNFLSSPSPNITKQAIDFAAADLPEYSNYYACILDNVLSASECSTLIHAVEAQTNGEWHQATINSGFNGQEVDPEARVCGRIIWPNEDLAAKIWERCKGHVPEICEVNAEKVPHITGGSLLMKGWRFKAVGLNEGMRFLRYFDGNYFRPHFDGTYRTKEGKISFFTLHLYLNEADEDSMLEGGATTFHGLDWSGRHLDVVPKVGRVLLFQQKGLLHSGADVKRGIKFTMRTDVMFKKV